MSVRGIVPVLYCMSAEIGSPEPLPSRDPRANRKTRCVYPNAYVIREHVTRACLHNSTSYIGCRFIPGRCLCPEISPFLFTSTPLRFFAFPMTLSVSSDVLVLVLGVVLAALYLFRDQVFSSSTTQKTTTPAVKETNGHGNPRDFVAKMKAGVCCSLIPPSFVFLIIL